MTEGLRSFLHDLMGGVVGVVPVVLQKSGSISFTPGKSISSETTLTEAGEELVGNYEPVKVGRNPNQYAA